MLALEREARASYNYLERLVDPATGYTYFDVFRTDPAEAVHDWPDFLDVPGRSAESCVLLRHMTGHAVATEEAFWRRITALQEDDGLFYRPETPITRACVHIEEQALVMNALVARVIADDDAEAEERLARLLDGLLGTEPQGGSMPPMILRPVVRAWEELGMESAQRLAERTVADLRGARRLFEEDGSFAGHVHSHLFVAAGLTEYGRLTEDGALVEWMDRVFRWIRSQSTSFGLVPELARREDDVIACETCCLMDYIHLALSLTRTGRVEYFDDVERAVRNHLIESRVRSGEWLPTRADATDDEYALRAGLREAVLGAYGGWTGPNHILAYDETLPAGWVKSEEVAGHYLHKVRALQNCCGPSGPKALYLAWQHAARIDGSTLTVNLLLDRALPRAEIRCHEPREGRLTVTLGAPLTLKVRIPEGVPAIEVRAERKGRRLVTQVEGSYLTTVTPLRADDVVNIHYPLREREERITLGNAGFQQYGFRVRWRGSSVVSIEPEEGNASQGRSMLEEEPVRLYYGAEGPHPLYQRGPGWRGDESPAELHSTLGPEVW